MMFRMICLLLTYLCQYVLCGKFRWSGWTFQDDKIEIRNLEIYNRHRMDSQLWDDIGLVSQTYQVPFNNNWLSVPNVFFGVTQVTEDQLQGSTIFYKAIMGTITQTGFGLEIKKNNHKVYKTSINYFAYINSQIDHDYFTINCNDPSVKIEQSAFRSQITTVMIKTINFKAARTRVPVVVVVWHGYTFDPRNGNSNQDGIWFRYRIVDGSITETKFALRVEVLTSNTANIEFYGGYLLVAMEPANLPFSGIDYGFDEKESDVATKFFHFYSNPIETNNTDFSSSIFYGFAGFQSPLGGSTGTCDTKYTAVYSEISYDPVSSRFRFQISGNPQDCFHQILYRVSAYWILFKRKRCVEPKFIFAGNYTYCVCVNGTYEGQTNGVQSCFDCNGDCKSCEGSSNKECTECRNNMDLSLVTPTSGQCTCDPPRIRKLPLSTYYCIYCYKRCQLCLANLPTDCIQCYNNMTLVIQDSTTVPPSGICVCNPGLNEKDLRCYGCHYSCKDCIGTDWNQCKTCAPTRTEYAEDAPSVSCPCESGYFETFMSKCGKCHDDCVTCTGPDKSDCLQCSNSQLKLLIVNNYESTGFCGCPDGFFIDGTKCTNCQQRCLICANSSDCYRCNPDYELKVMDQSTYGTCECRSGSFDKKGVCTLCPEQCVECIDPGTCTVCIAGLVLKNSVCSCMDEFYMNSDGQCIKCPVPCVTCTKDRCITCVDTSTPKTKGFECVCADGYYLHYNICQLCNFTCKTCSNGGLTDCLSCNPGQLRELKQESCDCKQTYYESNEECLPCQHPCDTCTFSGQIVECLTCAPDASLRVLKVSCSCTIGYFEQNQKCLPCAVQCISCVQLADHCLICRYSNSQPPPVCLCDSYLQLNRQRCLLGRNVTLFTYFDPYGDYQYIRIESEDELSYQPEKRILQQENQTKLGITQIANLFSLKTDLECPFSWKSISIGPSSTANTSIVLQANYQANYFSSAILQLTILDPDSIVNQELVPLHRHYKIPKTAFVGPYQSGGVDAEGSIAYMSDILYSKTIDATTSDALEVVRISRIASMLLPTFWGIAVIVEGCQIMPPILYIPLSMATSLVTNTPPLYSLQYPYTFTNQTRSFSSVLHEFGWVSGKIKADDNSISPNLFRMNYTGIFLVDAADSLIIIGIVEVVHWAGVTSGTGQSAKIRVSYITIFLRVLRHQVYRSESYHIIKLTVLGLINLDSDANRFEVTSALISLLLCFLLIKEAIKALLYGMHFHQAMILKKQSPPKVGVLGYQLHLDEDDYQQSNPEKRFLDLDQESFKPLRPWDYMPYNADSSVQSRLQLTFHAIVMIKRIVLGFVVAVGIEEQNLLISLMVLEIVYVIFKIYALPYRHPIFYLKLVGDFLYLIAVIMLAFMQRDNHCEEVSQTVPLTILICMILFVIFYLISMILTLLFTLFDRKPDPLELVLIPRPIIKKASVVAPPIVEEDDVSLQEIKPVKKAYYLSKDKLFSYSKLFNKGMLMNSNLIKIDWASEMIKDEKDLDSSGVKYTILFLNKSNDKSIQLSSMTLSSLKFNKLTGQQDFPAFELQPQQSNWIKSSQIMDLASLDIYDDRLVLQGTWRCSDDPKPIDFALCTSELKIIENIPVTLEELLENAADMYMTFEYPQFQYDLNLFDMMKHLYGLVSFNESEGNYITKMCTHFHKYPRLFFYLELKLGPGQDGTLKIIANRFDQGLISDSGYQQVIEHFGKAVVDFLSVETVLNDGLS